MVTMKRWTTARRRWGAAAACGAAAVLALGSCSDGAEQPTDGGTSPTTQQPTESPSAEPSPTDDETTGDGDEDTSRDEPTSSPSPFDANTERDTSEPAGDGMLTVTDIRVGTHDGFDRVVFDLGGSGTPGWRVEYVDEALDDGSGKPVQVDGDAILQVVISGTAMPMDSGIEEYDGATIDPDDTASVEQVVYRFWFEGYTTSFIGVEDERKPFRVFSLTDPTRVVVDIQH